MLRKLKETYVRVNTRIRDDQSTFIKKEAKKSNKTEGEIYRAIVDYYINNK